MCSIHTVEYHSVFKRKRVLQHAATWMNLQDMMLNEISQSQKDKYAMIWDTVKTNMLRLWDTLKTL